MLAHHSALTTQQAYARDGSDPNLRALADTNTPMIRRHLQEAETLQRAKPE